AYDSLTNEQFEQLQAFAIPLPIDITTIEAVGGGSVRCMMAEIFLARKEGLTP
ncbi:MAG: amidinotransferase, partial [Bacteroidetes bacterium]|nr:amidinotransferase [Bacteroidota bacterium]